MNKKEQKAWIEHIKKETIKYAEENDEKVYKRLTAKTALNGDCVFIANPRTMAKEQWDYVGKYYLPDSEPIAMYKDIYGVWINPFTKKKRLILIQDKSGQRNKCEIMRKNFDRGMKIKRAKAIVNRDCENK